jgi:CRP-like cAMP-binding protein
MLSKDKARDIARGLGWLSQQPAAFQDDLISRCQLRRYREREILIHKDDPPSGVYCLVSGTMKLEFPAGGDYKIMSFKQPTFWFGQVSSMSRHGSPLTITAASQVDVLHLPLHDFERLMENAENCRLFSLITLEHFNGVMQMVTHQLINNVERRVALRLALLARRSDGGLHASVPISQADLAEMCGLSRPTVQQILSIFERRGMIRTGYRRIEIVDARALETHGEDLKMEFVPEPAL